MHNHSTGNFADDWLGKSKRKEAKFIGTISFLQHQLSLVMPGYASQLTHTCCK